MRKQDWFERLNSIYKDENTAIEIADKIEQKLISLGPVTDDENRYLSEKDVMLITYADSIFEQKKLPLETLNKFLLIYCKDSIKNIHILPFFPYSSDDGFSVIDYLEVNKDFGSWKNIQEISKNYGLMVDAVVNHISKKSAWFQYYLKGVKPFNSFFIEADPNADYSSITRPRALPLLTLFNTSRGEKYLWTTFSEDQIDLNFKSPDLLLSVLDVVLYYAQMGAKFIRLDAVGFIWKELGTTSMHLKETHEIIKLMKLVLEDYNPSIKLITETNVPQKDNISYFGTKADEAAMIYQFPLPPLVMHTLQTENASKLTTWAKNLYVPEKGTTYFNFLSSHDGIGVRPTEGILSDEERNNLVRVTYENGGKVSFKNNGDGTTSPYELNINYFDALIKKEDTDEIRIKKMLSSLSILLSLQGVPAIYIHSLVGSRNDYYGLSTSGIPRRINREKLNYDEVSAALEDKSSLRSRVFYPLKAMLDIRKEHTAFSPSSAQEILELDSRVFALKRKNEEEEVVVVINISSEIMPLSDFEGIDLLSQKVVSASYTLKPFEVLWIKVK